MEVYFLRHGETAWNKERRIQGSTAWTDLTEDGVRLAESTVRGLAARGLKFDRLFTSPYQRALHTARIIGDGLGLEPVADDRLCEISFGPYEGTQYSDGLFADDNIRACFRNPPAYVARDGAESFETVADRVKDFIYSELKPLAATCDRVLVVAHGGILRTVVGLATGRPLADFWKGHQPNCCAHVATLDDEGFALVAQSVVFS